MFFFFFCNLPLSNWICRRHEGIWKLRLETSLLFWPSGGTFSFGKGENPNRKGPKRPDMMTTVLGVGEVEFSPEIRSMKLETSQNTSRLNLVIDIWFGKTRNIDNIYQRWRQQNEQSPARNVFVKGEQYPSRHHFFCMKGCFFWSFVRHFRFGTSTICRQIFRFGTSTKTPPNRHGVFLEVLWILLGRRTGGCHGLRGGENGKTWAAEGGLSFFLGFGFSWDFPCFPQKDI